MTYLYYCPTCKQDKSIVKSMNEAGRKETCKECKSELKRIYTASSVKTSDGIKL